MGEERQHNCMGAIWWRIPSYGGVRLYALFLLCFYLTFCTILCPPVASQRSSDGPNWKKPGCHLVGYRKDVRIPGCHSASVQMNACRGFCITYSFPSDKMTLERSSGYKLVTSHGSCCTIKSTHDVHVTLQCEDNHVYRDTFKSAAECECAICDQAD